MKAFTDESYYNILEKCTIEAFEILKTKDFYPNNGTKAVWDVSGSIFLKEDGLPTNNDNALFRKGYIKANMNTTFLVALDRHWKKLEIKHSITRSYFYKKCYQSLIFKISQSPLLHKPDFGFDINTEPCVLTFIWSMSDDIEARSIEYRQQQPIQQHPKFEPNLWNNDCFELFKYLYDCYYKNTNRQLTNIWFYLKEHGEAKYNLKATKDIYKDFILKNYRIKLTNFDKAQTKWEDKERSTINDHRINFEDGLKQIVENAKNT